MHCRFAWHQKMLGVLVSTDVAARLLADSRNDWEADATLKSQVLTHHGGEGHVEPPCPCALGGSAAPLLHGSPIVGGAHVSHWIEKCGAMRERAVWAHVAELWVPEGGRTGHQCPKERGPPADLQADRRRDHDGEGPPMDNSPHGRTPLISATHARKLLSGGGGDEVLNNDSQTCSPPHRPMHTNAANIYSKITRQFLPRAFSETFAHIAHQFRPNIDQVGPRLATISLDVGYLCSGDFWDSRLWVVFHKRPFMRSMGGRPGGPTPRQHRISERDLRCRDPEVHAPRSAV